MDDNDNRQNDGQRQGRPTTKTNKEDKQRG